MHAYSISSVLEHIELCIELYKYLKSHFFYQLQLVIGIYPIAIIDLTEKVSMALESGKIVGGVFLDLKMHLTVYHMIYY